MISGLEDEVLMICF